MKCDKISEMLSLYIDNMLDESQMREVQEHLAVCDACKQEYDELVEIIGFLGEAETFELPEEFQTRLRSAIKEEKAAMTVIPVDFNKDKSKINKKNRWRMFTSIAAVFTVGVLSIGLYNDVLNIIPDKISGGGQEAVSYMKAPETTEGATATADAEPDLEKTLTDAGVAENQKALVMADDSVMLKEKTATAKSNEPVYGNTENYNDEENSGMQDSSNYSVANETAFAADISSETANKRSANTYGYLKSPQKSCNRSMEEPGIERNTAAVQFYNSLISEKLDGFDYQMLDSCYIKSGEWKFKVLIFRGKDGTTYNEEIGIIGKEGAIQVISSNESMGL